MMLCYVYSNLATSKTDQYIGLVWPIFRALNRFTKYIKHQQMHCNSYQRTLTVLWPPTCFGQSCVLPQGDFFENKNTVVITLCLNHSEVLKTHIIAG